LIARQAEFTKPKGWLKFYSTFTEELSVWIHRDPDCGLILFRYRLIHLLDAFWPWFGVTISFGLAMSYIGGLPSMA
jgi:hypothetical protein